jgi:hypothetical protein
MTAGEEKTPAKLGKMCISAGLHVVDSTQQQCQPSKNCSYGGASPLSP